MFALALIGCGTGNLARSESTVSSVVSNDVRWVARPYEPSSTAVVLDVTGVSCGAEVTAAAIEYTPTEIRIELAESPATSGLCAAIPVTVEFDEAIGDRALINVNASIGG